MWSFIELNRNKDDGTPVSRFVTAKGTCQMDSQVSSCQYSDDDGDGESDI